MSVRSTRLLHFRLFFALSNFAFLLLRYSSNKVSLVFLSKTIQTLMSCLFPFALRIWFRHSGACRVSLFLFNPRTSLLVCLVISWIDFGGLFLMYLVLTTETLVLTLLLVSLGYSLVCAPLCSVSIFSARTATSRTKRSKVSL